MYIILIIFYPFSNMKKGKNTKIKKEKMHSKPNL